MTNFVSSLPYTCKLSKCACGKGRVPDIIFSTVEPPPNAPITGQFQFFIQFPYQSSFL